jgi:hypothetical protein
MIGAEELILAGVDSGAIVSEHGSAAPLLEASGFDPISATAYAQYTAQDYPGYLIALNEKGEMSYQECLVAAFAAAYCEGLIAGARATRAEAEDA